MRLAQNLSSPNIESKGKLKIYSSESGSFSLIDDFVDDYENLIDRLFFNEGWGEKFSEKYISKILDELLIKVQKENSTEKVANQFNHINKNFENFNEETTVYLPLTGIKIFSPEFQIGPITIKIMNEEAILQLSSKAVSVIMQTKNSGHDKEAAVQSIHESLNSLKNMVCSVHRVIAEPIRARERAEEETRRVLDVLRFSIPSLYRPELNVSIGLFGEVCFSKRLVPTFSEDIRFGIAIKSIGPLCQFEVSNENIREMETIGVFVIADLLNKKSRELNDFEEIIIRAIHWYSDSQLQQEGANQLLSLISCLETFFTPKNSDPIANSVAEGVALIIARDLESRKKVKQWIKKVYRIRSRISHGGEKDVLEKDLRYLSFIGQKVIAMLIKKKGDFLSQKNLLEWIEEEKLG